MSEHGRIIAVTERPLGSTLVADTASGATTLTVVDAAEFDDQDGGWLSVNDQVIQYVKVDDDTGIITLASGSTLAAAADEGDAVLVYDQLYQTIAVDKRADVILDGPDDNTDAIDAGIALHLVDKIDTGVRGDTGESVILEEEAGDWKIIDVLGLSGSGATGIQFEADDMYVLTTGDISSGTATMPLTHRPCNEGVVAFWEGVPQQPTEYSIDYDSSMITWPLSGFERAGDQLWVHYAYLVSAKPSSFLSIPYQSGAWRYLVVAEGDTTDRSAVPFDDSSWSVGQAGFGYPVQARTSPAIPAANTATGSSNNGVWIRREVPVSGIPQVNVYVTVDGDWKVYADGTLIGSGTNGAGEYGPYTATTNGDTMVLAVSVADDVIDPAGSDFTYIDVRVEEA